MILRRGAPVAIYTYIRPHKAGFAVADTLLLRRACRSGSLRAQHIATSYSTTPSGTKSDDSKTSLDPAQPGTAPERSVYLALHTSTPSACWPAVHSKASPLVRSILFKLKPFHGTVNVSHDPGLRPLTNPIICSRPLWNPQMRHTLQHCTVRAVSHLYLRRVYPRELIPFLKGNSALALTNPNGSHPVDNTDIPPVAPHSLASDGANSRLARYLYVCTHNV